MRYRNSTRENVPTNGKHDFSSENVPTNGRYQFSQRQNEEFLTLFVLQ
jgi:hypothetical protein